MILKLGLLSLKLGGISRYNQNYKVAKYCGVDSHTVQGAAAKAKVAMYSDVRTRYG